MDILTVIAFILVLFNTVCSVRGMVFSFGNEEFKAWKSAFFGWKNRKDKYSALTIYSADRNKTMTITNKMFIKFLESQIKACEVRI